jgi:hypothetical protein
MDVMDNCVKLPGEMKLYKGFVKILTTSIYLRFFENYYVFFSLFMN